MIKTCPFCSKVINRNDGRHVYACKEKTVSDKNEIKFIYIKHNFPNISNFETISYEYVDNNKSLPEINKDYHIDYKSIIFLLKYFKIPIRSLSESSTLISVEKYKKTCNRIYGVDNVSKSVIVKNKKKKTFLKNYGVDNIFKDKEFKDWIKENNFAWNNLTNEENKIRIEKQTISIKKYWANLLDEQKNKLTHQKYISNLETRIAKSLLSLNIPYASQFSLGGKVFDFRISNTNILIEVNGDFWHANPNIYKNLDLLSHPGKKIAAESIWEKDKKKRIIAENKGYKVLYFWESDINKVNNAELSTLILDSLEI